MRGTEHVLEGHSPDKSDDIQSRRVIRITKELQKRMDNVSSDFRELHGTDVNRLYQQLAVLWGLDDVNSRREHPLKSLYLLVILILSFL
jgi:hypothetical protein